MTKTQPTCLRLYFLISTLSEDFACIVCIGTAFCSTILYQEQPLAVYRLKSDKLISSLLDCARIEELDLNQCYQMSDLVSVLEKHPWIYSLHLANTQPSQTTLGAILTLTNLQKLDLGKGFTEI